MMYEIPEEQPQTKMDTFGDFLSGLGSFIFESVEAIVIALALSVVLYLFLFTPHEVVGRSMYPTYKNGEYLIANKIIYQMSDPEQGDVVIFKHSPTQDYIKRIVAMPGDTVSLRDGKLLVNGDFLNESDYLEDTVYTSGGGFLGDGGSYEVKNGEVFVSGDNRPHSADSRAFGPVDFEDIKGKVWVVYFPFDQARIIRDPIY